MAKQRLVRHPLTAAELAHEATITLADVHSARDAVSTPLLRALLNAQPEGTPPAEPLPDTP